MSKKDMESLSEDKEDGEEQETEKTTIQFDADEGARCSSDDNEDPLDISWAEILMRRARRAMVFDFEFDAQSEKGHGVQEEILGNQQIEDILNLELEQ